MNDIEIRTEFIKLDTFLKLADCVSTGGQAKIYVAEGMVTVNGEREERRGRKLYNGDVVAVDDCGTYRVIAPQRT
ncbi:S4 domain-containing protein YaaA [Paenibacillus sp. 481]|uniref:S4 domain-containing protein YaaA n=1 Tax=Paenibacillus sp. 481 TaxID=2835869 RepID=UPI001E4DA705|nr:S4 domain-containing protein YaaA [Paenibacillus sp. 481]UHA75363.1 S4 domain-containing protein YaaA [Paenibacillus sp. 481]